MAWVTIADVLSGKVPPGTAATVKGWVRTRRDSKAGLSFVQVHDGTCFEGLQVVAPGELANYADEVQRLSAGCAVECDGELVPSQGKGQAVELRAGAVRVVGWVEDPETYPVQPKRHSLEFLREVAHLRPRTNTFGAVARVRHCLALAAHRFFHERGFYWIHTPIITASDAEGAGELFRVSTLDAVNPPRAVDGGVDWSQDFFGKQAFLSVSGQLNVETYCQALTRVYTFGPTFRAENSNTSRHLSEFWMIEPEIAFADLRDDADLAEAFLKAIFAAVLAERPDDMAFFAQHVQPDCITRLERVVESSFERMTYTEAVARLQKSGRDWEFPVAWGRDLQSEHERYLCEELCDRPVVIMDYPKEIKAFYMRLNPDERTVAAMDVLAPGIGEIIGGSQREERLDVLDARIEAMGLEKDVYWWYRDLRRYGTCPHAGFGLGFDRALNYVTGLKNIRDVIPFPRAPKLADF
jgi:asparaginyl-tRNA synthetase